jgi:hypothetical protein
MNIWPILVIEFIIMLAIIFWMVKKRISMHTQDDFSDKEDGGERRKEIEPTLNLPEDEKWE